MKNLIVFLALALVVDINWYMIANSKNGVMEIVYDDGTSDRIVIPEKDVKSPGVAARVDKLIQAREQGK